MSSMLNPTAPPITTSFLQAITKASSIDHPHIAAIVCKPGSDACDLGHGAKAAPGGKKLHERIPDAALPRQHLPPVSEQVRYGARSITKRNCRWGVYPSRRSQLCIHARRRSFLMFTFWKEMNGSIPLTPGIRRIERFSAELLGVHEGELRPLGLARLPISRVADGSAHQLS